MRQHQQQKADTGLSRRQFGLVDTGGSLAGSTLYLVTDCAAGGVAGPAQVIGNPSSSSPTAQQLTQNFPFSSSTNQVVQFTYDLSQSQANGNLSITNGTSPTTGDTPLNIDFPIRLPCQHLICNRKSPVPHRRTV